MVLFVRGIHPACYRSGQWAAVVGAEWASDVGRPVLRVKFVDAVEDTWAVFAEPDIYEFAEKVK